MHTPISPSPSLLRSNYDMRTCTQCYSLALGIQVVVAIKILAKLFAFTRSWYARDIFDNYARTSGVLLT